MDRKYPRLVTFKQHRTRDRLKAAFVLFHSSKTFYCCSLLSSFSLSSSLFLLVQDHLNTRASCFKNDELPNEEENGVIYDKNNDVFVIDMARMFLFNYLNHV